VVTAALPAAGALAGAVGSLLGRAGGEGAEAITRDLKTATPLCAVPSSMLLVPGILARYTMLRRRDMGALARGKPLTIGDGHIGDDTLRRSPPWRR
jgi:hypothetical protein